MKTTLKWGISIFLLLGACVEGPHLGSLLIGAAGILLMPLEPIRQLWQKIPGFSGRLKYIPIVLLFVVGCGILPDTDQQLPVSSVATVSSQSQPAEPTPAPVVTATPSPVLEPTATPEPTAVPEPTSAPEPTAVPEPTSAPEPTAAPESAAPQSVMVWIPTHGGTKYHTYSGCSNMIDPIEVTLEEATAQGFTPCQRCH